MVLSAVASALRRARAGTSVDVVTADLGHLRVVRRIRQAIERGVHVRVVTRSSPLTRREKAIARVAARVGDPGNWVRQCSRACAKEWRDLGGRPGFVLVRDAAGAPTLRVDVSRNLSRNMVDYVTKAVVRSGEVGLRSGDVMLQNLG
jgi:CheY-like chemotaxis protein